MKYAPYYRPSFGSESKLNLASAHPKLRAVFERVIEIVDCKVLCGHRDKRGQDAAYAAGTTQVRWPNSMHNTYPSRAVDVVPYPVDWNNRERFAFLAGVVFAVAKGMGITIRWGGDFNKDGVKSGEKDNWDMPHYELGPEE